MKTLESPAAFQQALCEKSLLIVQLGSSSCSPCHAIRCKLDAWCAQAPDVASLYILIEAFPQLAAQLGVFTVPTILVYAQGRLTLRESGYFSLESILEKVQRYRELL